MNHEKNENQKKRVPQQEKLPSKLTRLQAAIASSDELEVTKWLNFRLP